ncbi:Uncharacterised protein [Mycobacterium tuberculosis]|nr:Uncharacterised protein [Mycobacterium tuberculosis]
MILDISCAHSFGVHGYDLILDAGDLCLMLLDNHRFKFAKSITWDFNFDLTILRRYCFLAVSVTAVASLLILYIMLGVAEFRFQFGFQHFLKRLRKEILQRFLYVFDGFQVIVFDELAQLIFW